MHHLIPHQSAKLYQMDEIKLHDKNRWLTSSTDCLHHGQRACCGFIGKPRINKKSFVGSRPYINNQRKEITFGGIFRLQSFPQFRSRLFSTCETNKSDTFLTVNRPCVSYSHTSKSAFPSVTHILFVSVQISPKNLYSLANKVLEKEKESISITIISSLTISLTMAVLFWMSLNSLGKRFLRGWSEHHLSYQNKILDPSPTHHRQLYSPTIAPTLSSLPKLIIFLQMCDIFFLFLIEGTQPGTL